MDTYVTYEERWKERKSFLFSSMLIGAIASVICSILLVVNNGYEDFLEAIVGFVVIVLTLFVLFSALIAVGRLVFFSGSAGGNIVTGFLNGFWLALINTITGGWLGIILGLCMLIIFFWAFLAVVAGYAIYLPISSVYLFVMYKRELAE